MDFLYGMFFLYKDSFFDIFLILKQKLKCANSCSCFLYSRRQTSGGSVCFNRCRHPQNFRLKNRPWRFLCKRGQTPGGSACFNRCRHPQNFRLKNRPWRFLNTRGQTPGESACFNRCRHPQNFRLKNRPWRFLCTRGQTPQKPTQKKPPWLLPGRAALTKIPTLFSYLSSFNIALKPTSSGRFRLHQLNQT